jgi:hypothetical protein
LRLPWRPRKDACVGGLGDSTRTARLTESLVAAMLKCNAFETN